METARHVTPTNKTDKGTDKRNVRPKRSVDIVGVVEAAYTLDNESEAWLTDLCQSVLPLLDRGLGVGAWTFDVRNPHEPQVSKVISMSSVRNLETLPAVMMKGAWVESGPRVYQVSPPVTTASVVNRRIGGDWNIWLDYVERTMGDFLAVVGRSPDGLGVVVGAPLKSTATPSAADKRLWSYVSAHLASAFRLRRALSAEEASTDLEPEAILTPGGVVEHALGEAESQSARDALRKAAIAVDRARSRSGRSTHEEALQIWTALTAGRWSLVDRFESDGRRYLVAIKNDPEVRDPRSLNPRERQVVGFAALGHSLKFISYELGIAPTTVTFHLKSALRKLGMKNRADLMDLAAYMQAEAAKR